MCLTKKYFGRVSSTLIENSEKKKTTLETLAESENHFPLSLILNLVFGLLKPSCLTNRHLAQDVKRTAREKEKGGKPVSYFFAAEKENQIKTSWKRCYNKIGLKVRSCNFKRVTKTNKKKKSQA